MQIFVLGMHRSGTSVVTRLVNMMGAYFGAEGSALGFSNRQNAKGFWERRDVIQLDQALLHSAGADWHRVGRFELDDVPAAAGAVFEAGAREFVHRLDAHRPWVVKEPRLCLLFPRWRPLLEAPLCVLVHRSPLAVAKSLRRRDGFPLSFGAALWERYVLDALTASAGLPRVSVSFEAIMEEPVAQTTRLWEKLSSLGVTGLRRPSPREVEAFIDPGHRHEHPDEEEEARLLHPAQRELAAALESGAALELAEVPRLSQVARQYLILYGDLVSYRDSVETLRQENRELREEVESVREQVRERLREFRAIRRAREAAAAAQSAAAQSAAAQSTAASEGAATQLRDVQAPADPNALPPDEESGAEEEPDVDVVVCVHNAFLDVRRCLASLLEHTRADYRLILVNDGSDSMTSGYLQDIALLHRHVTLLESAAATGYTRAANRGLRASRAGLVVLLNSDTIVTAGWLEGLLLCFASSERIGIVGPLSNAATYQSVPERFSREGGWEINLLPPGWNTERMARLVAEVSSRRFPRVPFVNGFCFAIRRPVIEAVGYLDEATFPRGYGEENDYCIRAAEAGFELAVADHVYVYHAMSKSYTHETRLQLSKDARGAFEAKHGREKIRRKVDRLREQPDLEAARAKIARALSLVQVEVGGRLAPLKVLFLLPVKGGGGGVHSIVQEVSGMRRLGCDARIAVPLKHLSRHLEAYPSLETELFVGYTEENLVETLRRSQVVVATIFTSVLRLAPICQAHPDLLAAYYIQDYEPWIVEPGSAYEKEALASYRRIPGMVCFAKTDWLCRTVGSRHGIEVHKVRPSLDASVYYPPRSAPEDGAAVRVAAMVRPETPYRGPKVTMEVLKAVSRKLGPRVRPILFGCEPYDPKFLELERDFEFENRGVLHREEVGELLRSSHVFVDFSVYQAFGRTALEAMACGCAVILPQEGGASEYAVDRVNSLVVDTSSPRAMEEALIELATDPELRRRLMAEGLRTASGYDIHQAAWSELVLFHEALADRRRAALAA